MGTLNEILGGAIDTPARFVATNLRDNEQAFVNWKAGWQPRLIRSLEAWERRQARATARQFPEEAIGALETLGYRVTAPGV